MHVVVISLSEPYYCLIHRVALYLQIYTGFINSFCYSFNDIQSWLDCIKLQFSNFRGCFVYFSFNYACCRSSCFKIWWYYLVLKVLVSHIIILSTGSLHSFVSSNISSVYKPVCSLLASIIFNLDLDCIK